MRLGKVDTEYEADGGLLESDDEVIALGGVELDLAETSVCRCCA
jgi:hypothetical protein